MSYEYDPLYTPSGNLTHKEKKYRADKAARQYPIIYKNASGYRKARQRKQMSDTELAIGYGLVFVGLLVLLYL